MVRCAKMRAWWSERGLLGWPLPGAEGVVPWGVGLGNLATEGEWGCWEGDRETQDGVRVLRGAGAYPSLSL